MITGFNTDVKHGAKVFHVQTEDKGRTNPKIETLVYMGGEILDNTRTSYEKSREELSEEQIMELMESQHKRVIRSIKIGKYDPLDTGFPEGVVTEASLDEVIAQHLAAEPNGDPLKLVVNGVVPLKTQAESVLQFETRKENSGEPCGGTYIRVKLVHPTQKVRLLLDEKTDENGALSAKIALPDWGGGACQLVIHAISEFGVAEYKFKLSR